MTSSCRVPVVAVPARDEERRLPALLEALARQTWFSRSAGRLRVSLVLNNCRDGSAGVADAATRRWPNLDLDVLDVVLPPDSAHVGCARRLAAERALQPYPDPSEVLLLTTDADAVPDPDWIEANLRSVGAGADIVGGLIIGDPEEEAQLGPGFLLRAKKLSDYANLADRLASLIDPLAHDPWPRHRDHTGASLAVRGDVYRAVGGLAPLPFREDLDFVARVRASGGLLRHAPDVRVQVSARLVGRARGGMADCLKDWLRAEAENRPLLVEAPEAIRSRLERRRQLRGLAGGDDADYARVAAELGRDTAAFTDAGGRWLMPCALVERYAPDEPDAAATMAAEPATIALRRMVVIWEATSVAA